MLRTLAHRSPARALLAGLVLGPVLGSAPAHATARALPSGRDNTLYESATGSASNGAGPTFFAGRTAQASNSIRRGLLWFDVAGIVPAGSVITGVRLRLVVGAAAGGASAVGLHRANAAWGEGASNAGDSGGSGAAAQPGDATWLHRFQPSSFWATPGGDFAASPSASAVIGGPGAYTWESTPGLVADVQAWLDTPSANFGWLVRGDESAASTSKRFESRESATPGSRPILFVSFTQPVPAAPTSWGRLKAQYAAGAP